MDYQGFPTACKIKDLKPGMPLIGISFYNEFHRSQPLFDNIIDTAGLEDFFPELLESFGLRLEKKF